MNRLYSAGKQCPRAASFPAGTEAKSIMQQLHLDPYELFQQLPEGTYPLGSGRPSSSVGCWTRIAQAVPYRREQVDLLTEVLVTRNRPAQASSFATPGLMGLVQAAAHLQANRLTRHPPLKEPPSRHRPVAPGLAYHANSPFRRRQGRSRW